jgi:hypothetical protein
VGSWVQQTVWEIVLYVLKMLAGEWSNQAWDWFSGFFSAPVIVLDDPLVVRLVHVAVGVTLGFLPVAVAWMATRETVARLDGAGTIPPELLIRRAMTAGVAVTATSAAAWFMTTLAEGARSILAAVGLDINLLQQFFAAPDELKVTLILLALVFVIGTVILVLQRYVIAAEFSVLLVMGPLMAAGLLRDDGRTAWNIWLREMTALLATPLIQLLVTLLFVRKFAGGNAPPDIAARLASLAYLWVLYNTPRWARQMVYSVGTGDALVSSAANVGRMLVMRQLMQLTAAAAAA